MSRHAVCVLAITILTALLAAAPASGGQPLMFSFEVDQTVYAAGTSAVCGFDVYVTTQGTAHAILFLDKDGSSVVREIDWNSGWTLTFTAPMFGTSLTQVQAGPLITTYPEGTDIGDPAIATVIGSNGRIGNDPAEAGRRVFNAVVVFVDPVTGIPGIDLLELVSESGHIIGNNTARRCAALTPD